MDEIEQLSQWIRESRSIVFFGGAGVSTESGIPDFRSATGLYSMNYQYPPEQILSHRFFVHNTAEFYKFYRDKMLFLGAQPNKAHLALAELERQGKLSGIVTQNIDGLHQKAGSRVVYELHGSVQRNYCQKCGKEFGPEYILNHKPIPRCNRCGGVIKPDVVLYEEALNQETIQEVVKIIGKADLLIIGGTSLAVYPAASFIDLYQGNRMILINKTATSKDQQANLVIRRPVGEVLHEAVFGKDKNDLARRIPKGEL